MELFTNILAIAFVLLVLYFFMYSWLSEQNKKDEENKLKEEAHTREEYIRKEYPNAYKEYWGHRIPFIPHFSSYYGKISNQYSYSKLSHDIYNEKLSDEIWRKLEDDILKKIEYLRLNNDDKKWDSEQYNFTARINNLILLDGEYSLNDFSYVYLFTTRRNICVEMKILHQFLFDACLENDLDYKYNIAIKKFSDNIENYKYKGIIIDNDRIKSIKHYLGETYKGSNTMFLYNGKIEGWGYETLLKTYNQILNSDIIERVNKGFFSGEWFWGDMNSENLLDIVSENFNGKIDNIVIIEACTTRELLFKNVSNVLEQLQDFHPKLAYISIIKCYDKEEMSFIIEKSIKEKKIRK